MGAGLDEMPLRDYYYIIRCYNIGLWLGISDSRICRFGRRRSASMGPF
jgi:hypothetical protein